MYSFRDSAPQWATQRVSIILASLIQSVLSRYVKIIAWHLTLRQSTRRVADSWDNSNTVVTAYPAISLGWVTMMIYRPVTLAAVPELRWSQWSAPSSKWKHVFCGSIAREMKCRRTSGRRDDVVLLASFCIAFLRFEDMDTYISRLASRAALIT